MLLSSQSVTYFRYHSFSPGSRCTIAFSPQLRQYPEMGGPLARIPEEGDMETRCGDAEGGSVREVSTPETRERKLLPRPKEVPAMGQ